MPTPSRFDSIKYGILRAIDISGFRVLDPVVRLFFGEEPQKQMGEIVRFMLIPIAFVGLCLMLWTMIAPRHKTKAGEVPVPEQVWEAMVVNDTFHQRENEKESDFGLTDEQRAQTISNVESLIARKEAEAEELARQLVTIEAESKSATEALLVPVEQRLDELKASNAEARAARAKELKSLADEVAQGTATQDQLLDALRADGVAADQEKAAEKVIKDELMEIRAVTPKALKNAQAANNSLANEIQHLKKRLDYLTSGNRSEKVAKAKEASAKALEKLKAASSPAEILASAKLVVRAEEQADRYASQSYPRAATIWLQVWRSLFTVFVGFVIAALIAIPTGILCGLNRIAMACLTPIISVFKPVSPVVWLVIFQIIVGAFFPDPATHPLFVFLNGLPLVNRLAPNPAMIFAACTVAMCAVWPALVNTALGVSSVEKDHLNVAKVLRLGLWSRLTKIIVPSALPLVFAGLRISLGVGWMVLIAAEALANSEGLGKYVWDQYQNGSSQTFANIFFACFVIGSIGFLLDRIMIVMQRLVSFDDGAAVV